MLEACVVFGRTSEIVDVMCEEMDVRARTVFREGTERSVRGDAVMRAGGFGRFATADKALSEEWDNTQSVRVLLTQECLPL